MNTQEYIEREGDFKVDHVVDEIGTVKYTLHQWYASQWEWIASFKYPGYVNKWIADNGQVCVWRIVGCPAPQGYYRDSSVVEQERAEQQNKAVEAWMQNVKFLL